MMQALGLILALLLVPLQTVAQQRPPIIDMHLHAYPIGSLGTPGTSPLREPLNLSVRPHFSRNDVWTGAGPSAPLHCVWPARAADGPRKGLSPPAAQLHLLRT